MACTESLASMKNLFEDMVKNKLIAGSDDVIDELRNALAEE